MSGALILLSRDYGPLAEGHGTINGGVQLWSLSRSVCAAIQSLLFVRPPSSTRVQPGPQNEEEHRVRGHDSGSSPYREMMDSAGEDVV